MAVPEPGCCDGPNELLRKILLGLAEIDTGGGGGNSIIVQDEGVQLTAAVAQFNFVGAGVTATAVGNNVTVTIPAGGTGDVVGPAVAVNNNIVTFDGVTGKLIKDSGVAISSLITSANLQSGAQAIPVATTTQAVVFPTAFASAPHVVCSMSRPAGGVAIQLNINSNTIATTGFSVRLSAATPDGTYILQWMAHI